MIRTFFLGLFLATPLAAQQVQDCDWIARADAIVEPWEDHTTTFANGNVRLALMDVTEPAAGSYHILILSPPYDEIGNRQCKTLGASENIGFSGVDWSSLDAGYDPAVGLTFGVDGRIFDGSDFVPGWLRFTLNQATGAIRARLR